MRPRLLCKRRIKTRIFLNKEGFPYNFFWYCETKNIRRKNMIPSFLSIIFPAYRNVSEKKETPYEHLRYCETKKFDKHLMHPCLLCKKSFRTRFFSKHRRVHLQIFSAQRDDKIPVQNLSYLHLFPYPNVSETTRVPPTISFGTVRQKSVEKPVMHPASFATKDFFNQNFFKTQKGSPTNFLDTVSQ